MSNQQSTDRAVVLGASMAGLCAARVLADTYAEVVVVDRDALRGTVAGRRGVPQSRHIHGLLARGQQVLEELFPGLTAELVARGARAGDMLGDVRCYFGGHRLRPATSGLVALCASRPLLEGYVRARVRALPTVSFREECDVVGVASTPDARRVTGARVIRRADSSAEEVIDAELVVDATGRGSRTPLWLDALGYPAPAEEQVKIGVGYATRTYRLAAGALGEEMAVIVGPTPEHPRGAGLTPIEGDRHILTLMGILGDHPPTTPDGFVDFARSLRFPDIHDALRDAEPLDEPVGFRFPANIRRRYERLTRFPDGLLVTGDAICAFNPIYGQGMTVAALEALALRRHLERHRASRFLRDASRIIDNPWAIAVGADLSFPGVDGRRTVQTRLINRYVASLHAAAATDATLGAAFLRVSGLLDPPQALLRPEVATRVFGRRSGRIEREPHAAVPR